MDLFIDAGFWRTRKSGRELNFGQDKFEVKSGTSVPTIEVFLPHFRWKEWGKTIGNITELDHNIYTIEFESKFYQVEILEDDNKTIFKLNNCDKSKQDTRFLSLVRSVIIKSIYCVGCGVCEAECKNKCIDMKHGVVIGDNCTHCHKCHDVREHCLRYNSIRNKITEGKKMVGLDRYFSFGIREQWLETYINYEGTSDFWMSDGDRQVPNKKKDAFKNFVDDAGIVLYDKKAEGDKYTKYIPTTFGKLLFRLGAHDDRVWPLILCNLAYTPAYNWFIDNLQMNVSYSPDAIKDMLGDVMENDTKGLGRRNILDALKIVMSKTPLGKNHIFAECNIDKKTTSSGNEIIKMNSITRCKWDNAIPEVILYALYKFAENCGDYYQFTLSTLLDIEIERDGVSPTKIFGIEKDEMVRILNGLTINYPEYISASFTLDLDNITLRSDKTSLDVLELF
jgi:phosphoadenosine phosphosulfate reductase